MVSSLFVVNQIIFVGLRHSVKHVSGTSFDDNVCPNLNGTDLGVIASQINGQKQWRWIFQRILHQWEEFKHSAVMVMKILCKTNGRNSNFYPKLTLIAPGIVATSMSDPATLAAGGPVGELTQWADLIAGLQSLGHTVLLRDNFAELNKWLRNMRCSNENNCTDVDIIFTDYKGYHLFDTDLQKKYKHKFRILDSFGTEAIFNDEEYVRQMTFSSVKIEWGIGLNLKQFYTMYPHSPDNSFLGFVVSSANFTGFRPKKENFSLLYGKEVKYLKDNLGMIQLLASYIPVKATLTHIPVMLRGNYNRIQRTGILSPTEYSSLLGRAKLLVGLRHPIEGVGIMNALADGCIIFNPKCVGNDCKFKNKPTQRQITSQVPYLEHFIGPPNVLTVNYNNETELRSAIELALKTEVKPLLPDEFSLNGYLKRLALFVEHHNFSNIEDTKHSVWPPYSEMQVVALFRGLSCSDACRRASFVCEPAYFRILNTPEMIEKFGNGVRCSTVLHQSDPMHPSFDATNGVCYLQHKVTLFSCSFNGNSHTHTVITRLCPCRTYKRFQIALPMENAK